MKSQLGVLPAPINMMIYQKNYTEDEDSHCDLVLGVANLVIAKLHHDLNEKIRMIRRLVF